MADGSVITGRVVSTSDGSGVGGVRVEALDVSGAFRDLLGYARTDADGRFRMEARASDLAALVGQREVVAYLRVIHQPSLGQAPYHLLADTRQSGPKWPLDGRSTDVTLRVDTNRVLARLPSLLPFVVSGVVHGDDGPVVGANVRVHERDPVSGSAGNTLREGYTDARGRYRILYDPPTEKDLRDLFVRVTGEPSTDSETRCHAPPSLVVNVVKAGEVWRGVSAFTRTTEKLDTALASSMDIKDLSGEQRERLACSLGLPIADVEATVTAHGIAHASSLTGEARDALREVIFAGLGRGMGTDRDSFYRHPKSAVEEALREAVAANQVRQAYAEQGTFDAAIQHWVKAAAEWSLEARSNPCGLGELLTVAGVTDGATRASFAEQLCANSGRMEDFWTNLTGTFDKPRLQLTLQWWSLTRGHLPLVQALESRRFEGKDQSFFDLAKLSEADWHDVLNTFEPRVPPDFPGNTEVYSRLLYRTMATAFPTEVFRNRLNASSTEEGPIKDFFFQDHPTFELGKKRLSDPTYAATLAALDALDPVERKHTKRLKAMERLSRFVPTYEAVDTLISKGYGSAHAVHSAGKWKFLADMQGSSVEDFAFELFDKACWQVRAATTVLAQYGAMSHPSPMKAFADLGHVSSALATDIPDWQTLFGNGGGCVCKHCSGVLGPAAYLADSLLWLQKFDSTVTKAAGAKWSAFDILVGGDGGSNTPAGRRPDLALLELTCKSAHTPQPYIDLTNELLEVAVAKEANPSLTVNSTVRTTFEPDALAAGPEILYEVPHLRAWRSLMQRRHPFTLPVCLFDREAEAYLHYLGVTRADIVETLGNSPEDLAKARLGVRDDSATTPGEDPLLSSWKMLLDTETTGTAQQHWGEATAATLKHVPTFLKYAGITFGELEELLATRYINGRDGSGAAGLAAVVLDEADGCDITAMTLNLHLPGSPVAQEQRLLRIQRFLRLRHRTGLSSSDLDLLLAAFSANPDSIQINPELLQKVTSAQALAKELKLTVREVAALFANLDVHERWEKKSPYRQLFLNRLVDSPEPALFAAVLDTPDLTANLTFYKTAIQQGLGISEKELALLVDAPTLASELFLPSEQLVLGALGPEAPVLASVSSLWRHVRFARALRLSLADYLVLRAYSGLTAIGAGASLADAKTFVDTVRAFQAQKLSAAELQWILRAFAAPSSGLAPDAADLEALRVEIASAVSTIVAETEAGEDQADSNDPSTDSRTRTFALLDQLVEPADRDAVIGVLRGSATPPEDPPASWRDRLDPIKAYLPGDGDMEEKAKDLLAGPWDPGASAGNKQKPPLLTSAEERFAYVARWLDRHVRASRAVIEKLATTAQLPVATLGYLVSSVLPTQVSSAPPNQDNAYRHLIDDFLPANKSAAGPGEQTQGLSLVLRHARLLSALHIGEPIAPVAPATVGAPGEVSWLYEPSEGGLHTLPAQQSAFDTGDVTRFDRVMQIARRVGLRDRMAGGAHALREFLLASPPTLEAARSLLAEKSGWELATLNTLCVRFAISESDPTELQQDANLLKLEKAISLVRRLGIDADQVLHFLEIEALPPPAAEDGLQPTTTETKNARDLVIFARHAAKAKLSADAWSRVAKQIRDPFRELLRDRLVDALVPSVHETRNDLYGHHLIDVDMSATMMTSRTVQATNALQVFVQRSFLGLDGQVKLPSEATREWEWRKAYRVWEANRKVFLWPENWLEPELRDDMTPLFRDFLTQLASGEITDASAERALERYLSGLHEIARLEPMALWHDHDSDIDHVIARTRSQPRKWFHRRREDGVWTPWEKMDIDIDAESVLLVSANRRLYLFWPQLLVKNDRPAPVVPGVDAPTNPGPHPIPELGESWEDFFERVATWATDFKTWSDAVQDKKQEEGQQPADQEPSQHYEVRVAWSSYLEGAWTPKRLSDCPPVTIANARGDRVTGYDPKHVLFVLEPKEEQANAGILRLACVALPWEDNEVSLRVGRFRFDACDGGRWTSLELANKQYSPTKPTNSRLSALGFEQYLSADSDSQAIVVKHLSEGSAWPAPVPIFDKHVGHFIITTPSRHGNTTHAFDRFLFADHKAIFFGRALKNMWTVGGQGMGNPSNPKPPEGFDSAALGSSVGQWIQAQSFESSTESDDRYALEILEHPYVCEFANRLAAEGVSGLLGWKGEPVASAQYLQEPENAKLADLYLPTDHIAGDFPRHEVSFEYGSTYGMYNWELFFHVPLTIAQRLSQEGRYAEAQKWYHHIFKPTTGLADSGPKRFWCVKPFYEIEDLATVDASLSSLAASSSHAASLEALVASDSATEKAAEDVKKQIAAMAKQPFSPHVIARHRPLAYMKNVFMRYLQNLLDWADSLFRRDTMESIHEALTLYLLAADLLGPRPQLIDHKADPEGKTFEQLLESGLDGFGNAAIEVETIVPKIPPRGFECTDDGPPMPDFRLYFCVPPNPMLSGLWDTVADRLFKIRNSMNIEGVARSLALFAPPIDPAILVRAFAAGVRLDQVLDSLGAPAPLYRFARLHAKAVEFAGAVQSLGQLVLAALEKRDGEELALLRQRHEITVFDAEREIRKQAIQEARETLEGLNRSKRTAETRLQYYTGLIEKGLLPQEKDAETRTLEAKGRRKSAADADMSGTILGGVPDVSAGIAAAVTIGGRAAQTVASAVARHHSFEAEAASTDASLAQTAAGYARRAEEWKLQKSVTEKELAQLDKQIAAQEIRVAMAEREVENLDLRREHSREIDSFFRSKFTNQDLYTWMSAQLASEHYRAYQTAFDMAKRAERAYQLERGDETTFVRFGAWDSLKKGLLAGERLLQDLRALDAAYLSRSDREREITKHISLAEIAGEQLTRLRDIGNPVDEDRGTAEIELHPYHFDADYPGHYFRRIKNVAITVATVKSAADGVQCELTLLKSAYRRTSEVSDDKPYPGSPYADDAHRCSLAPVKVLATSTAENDPGLFEVNLNGEMLLPVEGSGAVSQWRIELDHRTNRFPMHRISDVVLHLRYTAKDGGPGLREEAITYAQRAEPLPLDEEDPPNGLKQRTRVFSARRDFDEAWRVFTTGQEVSTDVWANRLELRFVQSQFRSFFGNPKVKIVRVQVSATFNDKYNPPQEVVLDDEMGYVLSPPGATAENGTLGFRVGEPSDSHDFATAVNVPRDDANPTSWIFDIGLGTGPSALRQTTAPELLLPDAFEDIWFIVTYEQRAQ